MVRVERFIMLEFAPVTMGRSAHSELYVVWHDGSVSAGFQREIRAKPRFVTGQKHAFPRLSYGRVRPAVIQRSPTPTELFAAHAAMAKRSIASPHRRFVGPTHSTHASLHSHFSPDSHVRAGRGHCCTQGS